MRVSSKTIQMEMFQSPIQTARKSPKKAREKSERQILIEKKGDRTKSSSFVAILIVLFSSGSSVPFFFKEG